MTPLVRGVSALAVGASLLAVAGVAWAEPAPTPSQAPAATQATATPLLLRPTPAAGGEHGTSSAWKATAIAGLLGAVGFVLYKKRREAKSGGDAGGLRIVDRTSLGVRSELVVVEVAGERFLIGVTPGGIGTLATLAPTAEPQADTAAAGDEADTTIGTRAKIAGDDAAAGDRRDFLRDLRLASRRPASTVADERDSDPPVRRSGFDRPGMEEQTRGLARLARRS